MRPISYDITFNRDIYMLLGGTVLLFLLLCFGKKKLKKPAAGLIVVTFIAYILYLITC